MNRIEKLVKDDGGVVEESTRLKLLITNFYKSLFESHADAHFEELLNQVHQKVTTDMNNYLMEEYGDEEIKQTLDSMGDLKASGVDGMPALFYKQY
jgi:2-hydroxychromene-2-carboxylate isomerase